MKFTHRLVVLLCCTATYFTHYANNGVLYSYSINSNFPFDSIDYNAVVLSPERDMVLFKNWMSSLTREEQVSIQLIQNVPAAAFDLYLNNELIVQNFNFRTATPFLAFPKGESFQIGLAPSNSTSSTEIMEYFDFKLGDERPYLLFINHDEVEGSTLMQLRDQVPKNATEKGLAISFAHGAFDMSPVDVFIDNERKFSNVGVGEITPYFSISNEPFQVDLRSIYTGQTLYSYQADLSDWMGQSAVLYTSGFMEDKSVPLSMQVTLPDATTLTLSARKEENMINNVIVENIPKIDFQDKNLIEDTIEKKKFQEEETAARGTIHDTPTLVFVEKKTIDVIVVLEKVNMVEVKLVDGIGNIVEQQIEEHLEKGKYFFDIRKKYLKAGLYDLQIQIGEKLFSHQVLVGK